MTKKKGKFLTFCFSLIPGAGEMYLGFLKQGVSIMTLSFLLFAVGGILFPPLLTFEAVIWFYSFFHTHNLNSMPDDEFYAIQDDYLIHFHQIVHGKNILLGQYRGLSAVVLILLGLSILWRNIHELFLYFSYHILQLPEPLMDALSWVSNQLPQIVIAVVIIFIGFRLIRSKKLELEQKEDL
ncbi:MAG: hypothetical protein Q4F29_12775 [Lachnospiraceae bacterium]|nr:hypothetical protein [Lachnospiraceae bacterium]